MVGGKIEPGEDFKDAISREVKEETGMSVNFKGLRGVVYETLYKGKKIDDHFIIWVCETQAPSANAIEQNEGKVKWFTWQDLEKNKEKIIPSDFAMIKEFFSGKKKRLRLHTSKMRARGKKYILEFFG